MRTAFMIFSSVLVSRKDTQTIPRCRRSPDARNILQHSKQDELLNNDESLDGRNLLETPWHLLSSNHVPIRFSHDPSLLVRKTNWDVVGGEKMPGSFQQIPTI